MITQNAENIETNLEIGTRLAEHSSSLSDAGLTLQE